MKEEVENLRKNYLIRQSPFVLIGHIFILQIAAGFLFFITSRRFTTTLPDGFYFYSFLMLLTLNVVFLMAIVLRWYSTFYVISEDAISLNYGVLTKKSQSIDILSIRSVHLKQGILGRLFNYGSLILESPLVKEDAVLRSIQNVGKHGRIIDRLRIKWLEDKSMSSITPVV